MNKLESVNKSALKVIEKAVAVVKFIGNKGVDMKYSRIGDKIRSYLAELMNLIERGARNVRDVLGIGKVRVKFYS